MDNKEGDLWLPKIIKDECRKKYSKKEAANKEFDQ